MVCSITRDGNNLKDYLLKLILKGNSAKKRMPSLGAVLMKKVQTKPKMDFKFIAITLVAIVLLCFASRVAPDDPPSPVDIKDLPEDYTPGFSKLIINEIVTSNGGVFVDGKNQLSDYIELYNSTSEDIDISGYGLSDRKDKIKWMFPAGTVVKAGGYLVVSLDGSTDDGLFANFKLSSAGKERVILTNGAKKVIDGVDTVALGKNNAMVRDSKGNWYVSKLCTPGFENSVNGYNSYIDSITSADQSEEVVINELLPKNKANFLNEYGEYAGFVELMNVSDHNVRLSDYTLSDSSAIPFRYRFDDVTLKPGEIYSLYLGDSDFVKTNYAGFKFSSGYGEIVLAKNGRIVQKLEYTGMSNGVALIRIDGKYYTGNYVSMGYENNATGIEAFQKKYLVNKKDLIINEVMTKNNAYLVQNGNKYYDWIELYNNGTEDVQLSEYSLSKDDSAPDMFKLPEKVLKPGEYYIIMCSGDTNLTNNSYVHANFKLGDTEAIYLTKAGKAVDSVHVCDVPYGYSYGRGEENGFFYLPDPTPGKANSTNGVRSIAISPTVSLGGGIYNDQKSLTVEITGPGTIYYTTDGSEPTKNSKKYDGPVVLNKTTVLRSRCIMDGERPSAIVTNSYMINENLTMPAVSLSMNPSDYSKIIGNAWTKGLEKQCYVEFYEADGSFSSPCSLSLFGGNARAQRKKSYVIRFDGEWGASELNYAVFDNRDNACYDALVLRSGSTDWNLSIIRDIVGTSLVDDYTDIDVQSYKSSILFINGEYYGIYNIREKVSAHFIEEHYNVSPGSVNLFRIDGDVTCGSKSEYNSLRSYARNHDMRVQANYDYMCEHFDMVNMCDYWIAEGFVTNNDLLNVRLFNSSEMDGKYRYIFYDLDYAWYNARINWYTVYIGKSGGMTDHYYENDVICALLKNSEFRKLWLERLSYNMKNTWHPDIVKGRIDEIVKLYEPEIARDRKEWGLSVSQWRNEVNLLKKYVDTRVYNYLLQTKNYFGLSNAQMKEYFGDLW